MGGQQSSRPVGQGWGDAIGMHTAPETKGPLSHQESDLAIPGGEASGDSLCSPTGTGYWTGIEDGQRQWNMATENTGLREEAIIDQVSLSEVCAA